MTSFHRACYDSTAKDHQEQQKVKVFARCIERLYSTEPIRRFDYRGIYRKEEDLNREISMREILMRDDTRYLREHFRCPECYKIGIHPNKEKVKRETKFCDKCFAKNVSVDSYNFKINFIVDVNDDANFGKIRYLRVAKPMVKRALENIDCEKKRVIRRLGEFEETLTLICEIYRYLLINGRDIFEIYWLNRYISLLKNHRNTYCRLWTNLKKYLDNIPEIKKKYLQLKEAQSRKDMCTGCFKCRDELEVPLKQTKKGMICVECQRNERLRNCQETEEVDKMRIKAKRERDAIRREENAKKEREMRYNIITECPICNEVFRQFDTSQMIKAGCGNHYFCVSCADSWRRSCLENTGREARCPMCRGDF
jgi:hypothetical protein